MRVDSRSAGFPTASVFPHIPPSLPLISGLPAGSPAPQGLTHSVEPASALPRAAQLLQARLARSLPSAAHVLSGPIRPASSGGRASEGGPGFGDRPMVTWQLCGKVGGRAPVPATQCSCLRRCLCPAGPARSSQPPWHIGLAPTMPPAETRACRGGLGPSLSERCLSSAPSGACP